MSTYTSLMLRSKPVSEITGIFLRFHAEEQVLRVISNKVLKVILLVKTYLIEIILGLKVTMEQVKTGKFFSVCFSRFLTSALTLRPQNTDIYVFRALFGFCNFLATCCGFWMLVRTSPSATLNLK